MDKPTGSDLEIEWTELLKHFRKQRDAAGLPLFDPEGQLPYRLLKMFVWTLSLFLAALAALCVWL